jgi:hypothetical protein
VHPERSEAGLRGHALLGCGTSSARSVPRASNPRSGGAWRSPPGYHGRGANRTAGRLGSA